MRLTDELRVVCEDCAPPDTVPADVRRPTPCDECGTMEDPDAS